METTRDLIHRYFEKVWNAADEKAEESLVGSGYRGYWLIAGMPVREGLPGHRSWLNAIRGGIRDLHYTVESLVIEGSRASARVRLEGTHTGVLNGLEGTGRSISLAQVFLFEVGPQGIVTEWVSFDRQSFLQQLKTGA